MPEYHDIAISNDEDTALNFIVKDSGLGEQHSHIILVGKVGEKTVYHTHDLGMGENHKHTMNGPVTTLPGF